MELHVILTAFIVISGLTHVEPIGQTNHRKIKEDLRNLLDSVNTNDVKKTENYRKILEQEAVREQQAFDTVKEAVRFARQRKAYEQENDANKMSNIGEKTAAFKREASNDGNVSTNTNYFGFESEYTYITVEYADEVPDKKIFREPCEYLCRAPDEERTKICKEALEHEFAVEHGIIYEEGGKLGEEKLYAFQINSGPYIVDTPLIISACTCPTSPLIYLQNKFQGFDVSVYMIKPTVGYSRTTSAHTGIYTLGDRNDDSLFE